MTINKDKFFRDVTLRICSSLDINIAFKRAFEYLRDHFPIDSMYFDIADKNLGANRNIAFATEGAKVPEKIIPLPEAVWKWVGELRNPFILTASDKDERIRAFAPYIELQGFSDLSLPLRIEDKLIGFLILRARGEGRYTMEHVELIGAVAEPFSIALANAISHETEVKYRELLLDHNRFLQRELLSNTNEEIIGANSGLRHVMEMVRQVASLSNTVLLMGETGTGKEVIANAIHFDSPRKDGPFIKVNCGAIPETLIDSELFGYEKGAFTGATVSKRGRFERADCGTIFLDEIGELPLNAQIRLLRVLQNREIERIGGEKPIPVDIRVIAATHRNLDKMVSENQFREDLWYRLNVFPIIIPPLRQRREDIPALTRYFVDKKSRELGIVIPPAIAPGALDRLTGYTWRGNVRELENLVERELIRHRGGQLQFDSVLPEDGRNRMVNHAEKIDDTILNFDEAMVLHITRVLKMAGGKIHGHGGAAKMLGINPSTLRGRMRKLGIVSKTK